MEPWRLSECFLVRFFGEDAAISLQSVLRPRFVRVTEGLGILRVKRRWQ